MNTHTHRKANASLRVPRKQVARSIVIALTMSTVTLSGCSDDFDFGLSFFEPTVEHTRHVQLIAATTELGSGFGDIATHEETALAIKTAIETELPCASVAVSGTKVTMDYGANGPCALHGITLQGTHSMTLRTEEFGPDNGALVIDHAWTNVSDGHASISGTGWMLRSSTQQFRTVRFSLDPKTNNTNLTGGQWVFSTMTDPQVLALNGSADWGDKGGATCNTNNAEIRWGDPAPQVGTYVLSYRNVSMGGTSEKTILFKRIDDTTIEAKVLGYNNPPDAFHIAQDGTYIRVQ